MKGREDVLEFLRERNSEIIEEHRTGIASPSTIRVLSVPKRKTGDLQTTPVSPFTVEGCRYVVAGMGARADWALNARAAGWGVIQNGNDAERVRFVELSESERGPILREFPRLVPHGVQFFTALYGVGPDPDEFEALAPRCLVFRLESEAEWRAAATPVTG